MVTLKKKPRTLETPANPKQTNSHEQPQSTNSQEVLGYEQLREKRIRENMDRMQKLGLFDLSSKFKSDVLSPKRKTPNKTPRPRSTPLQSSLPRRRSSRLQNSPSMNYSERKKEEELRLVLGDVSTPKKLLNSCEFSGELVVVGSGTGGKRIVDRGRRIYDQVNGKTCHQCRQKTLACVTHCNQCSLVTGQFCGDCLYLRYGEHVLEVNENPYWICPFCRGICNCSLCRQAKGLPAIGPISRKIKVLGFQSVHHYLIQSGIPVKRSLPFEDKEKDAKHKDLPNSVGEKDGCPKHGVVDQKDDALEEEKRESVNSDDALNGASDVNADDSKAEKEVSTNEHDGVCNAVSASAAKPDSIARRLRSRHKNPDAHRSNVVSATEAKPDSTSRRLRPRQQNPDAHHSNGVSATEAKPDSISGRWRPRHKSPDAHHNLQTESADTKSRSKEKKREELIENVASGSEAKRKRKSLVNQPNPDSIGARLRQRRSMA